MFRDRQELTFKGFVIGIGDLVKMTFLVISELDPVIVFIDLFNYLMIVFVIKALFIS